MNNGDEGFRIRNNFILINNICYEVIYNKNYCSACPDGRILHASYLSILTHRFRLNNHWSGILVIVTFNHRFSIFICPYRRVPVERPSFVHFIHIQFFGRVGR